MTSDNSDPGNLSKRLKNILKKQFSKQTGNKAYSSAAYEELDSPRKEMIQGIFLLSDQNARDIMIPRVDIIAIDINSALKPLVKIVTDAGHSRLPIYEETIDNIAGILYVKDLLKLIIADNRKKFNLRKILHKPFFVLHQSLIFVRTF